MIATEAKAGGIPRDSNWHRLGMAGLYALVVGLIVPIMFPYYVMGTSSLKTQLQNAAFPPAVLFTPTLDNYIRVFTVNKMHLVLLNSLIVGIASTGLGLVAGLPAAFAIARFRFDALGVGALLARMLPGIAMLIPWYLMFNQVGFLGTRWALIFSHLSVTLPLIVWVSIGFFEDLPAELLDAAYADGCSLLGAFWRIALPLVRAGVAASGMLAFIHSWNNFLYSLILGGKIVLAPVATFNMVAEYNPDWGAMNAAAMLTTWPVIVLSLPFGKNLVRGLTAGAVKGSG